MVSENSQKNGQVLFKARRPQKKLDVESFKMVI